MYTTSPLNYQANDQVRPNTYICAVKVGDTVQCGRSVSRSESFDSVSPEVPRW